MELEEEEEDEEWDTTTVTSTSQYKYSSESEPNANNGGKVKCVLKKILVAGFVASSAPLVLPSLFVASAIGVVISMPYALFLATHTCTQNLMNKLLPRPQNPPLLQDFCFQPDIDNDIAHKGLLEKIRDEGRIDLRGENVEGICRGGNESEQDIGLVVENREDRQSLRTEGEMRNQENSQVFDCHEMLQSRNDDMDTIYDEVESFEPVRGNLEVDSSNDYSQKPMTEETCELLDERGFQYESIPDERIRDLLIETQVFDISVDEEDSSVVTNDKTDTHENFQEEQKPTIPQMHEESNIMDSTDSDARKVADESGFPLCDENPDVYSYTIDLHNESSHVTADAHTESMDVLVLSVELDSRSSECYSGKNIVCPSEAVLFKEEWSLKDEAKRDNEMVDVNGDKEISEFGGVSDVVLEECCDEVKEGDIEEEELQRETKGMLEKIRDEGRTDMRGESCEPVRGNLEVDSSNDSQKLMAEETCEPLDERGFQYESIPAEQIRDLLIETQVFDIAVAEEDSSEVTNDKTDTHEKFLEEPESTILQKGKLDDNISDFENQEMQMHEDSKIMDSSDADARKIGDESGLPSCDENPDACSYTIDLHDESSNVAVDPHTDSMEVLVSSVELDSRSSECSSGKNIVCPSEEVSLNEGDIWKEIHAIRKIIGYEVTSQASCVDELKALYIFTGVEPPTFVKENPFDPAEINEKLHFLMSIVGIKSNVL